MTPGPPGPRDRCTHPHCGTVLVRDKHGLWECPMAASRRHLAFDEWFARVADNTEIQLSSVARMILEHECRAVARELWADLWTVRRATEWLILTRDLSQRNPVR